MAVQKSKPANELTSEFRDAKLELDKQLDYLLRQELEMVDGEFPEGNSQRNGALEDACCSHIFRTYSKYWELLAPAPVTEHRRSQLLKRAVIDALNAISVRARKCGGYETVKNYADGLIQQGMILSRGSIALGTEKLPANFGSPADAHGPSDQAELLFATYERITKTSEEAGEAGRKITRAKIKCINFLDLLSTIFVAWRVPPEDVSPDQIEHAMYLLSGKYKGGVELDRESCRAFGVDDLGLADQIRTSMARRTGNPQLMLTPKLPGLKQTPFSSGSSAVPRSETRRQIYRFEILPGTKWSGILIRFLDGHTVTIVVNTKTERRTFAEMNMKDGRNGNPTKQWRLLELLARNGGRLAWTNSEANLKQKKQIELLAHRLQEYFGIAESPFHDYKKGSGWQFKLRLEAPR
jgi:hypothetical protein